jgi:hypothetical protein
MTTAETLERGRAAFEVSAWVEAYDCLAAANAEAPLAPADIELFASAAFLIGRDDESSALWARAHRAHLDLGDVEQAAGCAAWLAFGLITRGEVVQAGSWIMRAVKLLDGGQTREIRAHYEAEPEFQQSVNRYVHDFEAMLRRVLAERDGGMIAVTLLSSDMGKLYAALAQALERRR